MILLLLSLFLQEDLGSLDPGERRAAREAVVREWGPKKRELKKNKDYIRLGVLGEKSAASGLMKMIQQGNAAAAEAFRYTGSKSGVRILLEALKSDDKKLAYAAARALKGTGAVKKVDSMVTAVAAGDVDHVFNALPDAEAVIAALSFPEVRRKIRISFDNDGVRAGTLKSTLESGRDRMLALLLWRSRILALPDAMEYGIEPRGPKSVILQNHLKNNRNDEFKKLSGYSGDDLQDWWGKNYRSTVDRDVPAVIEAGVGYLRSIQKKDGSWDFCDCRHPQWEKYTYTPGTTALMVYTLLECDVPWDDPQVLKGIQYLLTVDVNSVKEDVSTYTMSLMSMALSKHFSKKKDGRVRKQLQKAADWLIAAQWKIAKGGYEYGPWSYEMPSVGGDVDNSNTQFAILGLRAAQNVGIRVPGRVWANAARFLKSEQFEDGWWPYAKEGAEDWEKEPYNSMTSAGICGWIICRASEKKLATTAVAKEEPVEKAMKQFAQNYPVPDVKRDWRKGHATTSIYYELYCLERAMVLGGFDDIGGKDWYHDGALHILYNQLDGGAWVCGTDTCWALLFLKKSFVPVASKGSK